MLNIMLNLKPGRVITLQMMPYQQISVSLFRIQGISL